MPRTANALKALAVFAPYKYGHENSKSTHRLCFLVYKPGKDVNNNDESIQLAEKCTNKTWKQLKEDGYFTKEVEIRPFEAVKENE